MNFKGRDTFGRELDSFFSSLAIETTGNFFSSFPPVLGIGTRQVFKSETEEEIEEKKGVAVEIEVEVEVVSKEEGIDVETSQVDEEGVDVETFELEEGKEEHCCPFAEVGHVQMEFEQVEVEDGTWKGGECEVELDTEEDDEELPE